MTKADLIKENSKLRNQRVTLRNALNEIRQNARDCVGKNLTLSIIPPRVWRITWQSAL